MAANNAESTTSTSRWSAGSDCMISMTAGGTVSTRFRVTDMQADGFQLSYQDNNPSDWSVNYLAIGGADVTNVKVGGFLAQTSTGNQTVGGLGFSPDIVFLISAGTTTANANRSGGSMSFGFARTSSQRGVVSVVSEDGRSASECARYQRTNRCLAVFNANDKTVLDYEVDYVGPTNDGFTLNYLTPAAGPDLIYYLAIKGGRWNVGSFNAPTTNTDQTILNLGFTPKFVLLASNQNQAATTIQEGSRFMVGAGSSSLSRWTMWTGESDGNDPSQANRGSASNRIVRFLTDNADVADVTVNAAAELQSLDVDGFTLDWDTPTDTTVRNLLRVNAGDSPVGPTLVTKTNIHKYGIQKLLADSNRHIYHMGGASESADLVHRFNLLGKILKPSIHLYGVQTIMTKTHTHKYNVALAAIGATKEVIFKYSSIGQLAKLGTHLYTVEEDPSVNSRGYGKPLRPEIIIMSHDGQTIFHEYNSFHPEDSDIVITNCDVTLADVTSGSFSLTVADSSRVIDPSIVGEGCRVLIRAAKSEAALHDGNHDLMLGYIKSKTVDRPDTNVLEYQFSGVGSKIRFNERITNFSMAAERASFNSTTPNAADPRMMASNLVKQLLETSDHLPIGTPIQNEFTLNGVVNADPKVTEFIPEIDQELVEFSAIMNDIAEAANADWGVDAKNDVFLRYPTQKHSGITIKGTSSTVDDRYKTAYFRGAWSYEDSIRKEDGFTNRFFAKSGSRSVVSNTISVSQIASRFSSLVVNQPPTDPVTTDFAIGVFLPMLMHPTDQAWEELANIARQFPRLRIIAEVSVDNGPGLIEDSEYKSGIENLKSAGIKVVGKVLTNNATRLAADCKLDIDRWDDLYQVDGVYFDLTSTSTQFVAYYKDLSDHARINRGLTLTMFNAITAPPPEEFFSQTGIDIIVIRNGIGLDAVSLAGLHRTYFVDYPITRRAVVAFAVTTTAEQITALVQQAVDTEIAGFMYITSDSGAAPFDTLSLYIGIICREMDRQVGLGRATGGPPLPPEVLLSGPTLRDLAQSFIPETSRLNDLIMILSKVGKPTFESTGGPTGGEPSVAKPNSVHGHIESSKLVETIELDPQTGVEIIKEVEQPSGTPLAFFDIPFNEINATPTVIFLNKIVYDPKQIIPGQRYWVVLFGRGQNEENTIRWHHSDQGATAALSAAGVTTVESSSAERVPGGHGAVQKWETFIGTGAPAFALSFFDTTLAFAEASDPDSIEQFGLVESAIDISWIDDEELTTKFLYAVLSRSAKPRRIYEPREVTAPDDLFFPGQLVNIEDELSAHSLGSTSVEAEILEARYTFDSGTGVGAHFVGIRALGYVDFSFQKWKKKFERGEITIPLEGDVIIMPPPPLPDPTCEPGHHWDKTVMACVPDIIINPPPPPPPPPPPFEFPTPPDLPTPLRQIVVDNVKDWIKAIETAIPGDEIVVRKGTYTHGPHIFKNKSGNSVHQIVCRAQAAGSVTICGAGGWEFHNFDWFTWYGFNHRTSVKTRNKKAFYWVDIDNCRVARCDFKFLGAEKDLKREYDWLNFESGADNRIDHNIFHEKPNEGRFIMLGHRDGATILNTIIERNYFYKHTYPWQRDEGPGISVELGSSESSKVTYNSIVRYNLFEKCNGWHRLISIKSCGNTIIHNTFENCLGSVVIRNGNTNKIIANLFDGKSGVRIYGANNVIARNQFINNTSEDKLLCPIFVGSGDVEQAPNGGHSKFEEVQNAIIILNTIMMDDCTHKQDWVVWNADDESDGDLDPDNCTFRGNIIKATDGKLFDFENGSGDADHDFGSDDNILHPRNRCEIGEMSSAHYINTNPLLTKGKDDVFRIQSGSPANNMFPAGTFSEYVTEDLDGETYVGQAVDAGSDQFSTATSFPIRARIRKCDVGPGAWP